jgi:hypothetical protein
MKRSFVLAIVVLVGAALTGCAPEQQPPQEKVSRTEQPLCANYPDCTVEEDPPTSCPSGYILVDGACKRKKTCPSGYTYDSLEKQCVKACGCGTTC